MPQIGLILGMVRHPVGRDVLLVPIVDCLVRLLLTVVVKPRSDADRMMMCRGPLGNAIIAFSLLAMMVQVLDESLFRAVVPRGVYFVRVSR